MERLEHIILESFKKRAAQDVMWWEGSWLTGADLLDLVEKDRAALEAAGFKEGQRLMTLLPNCPALEALALAVWSLKGTLIPMNMRAGVDNLLPTIDLVQPFAIVVSRGDDKAASGVRRSAAWSASRLILTGRCSSPRRARRACPKRCR